MTLTVSETSYEDYGTLGCEMLICLFEEDENGDCNGDCEESFSGSEKQCDEKIDKWFDKYDSSDRNYFVTVTESRK